MNTYVASSVPVCTFINVDAPTSINSYLHTRNMYTACGQALQCLHRSSVYMFINIYTHTHVSTQLYTRNMYTACGQTHQWPPPQTYIQTYEHTIKHTYKYIPYTYTYALVYICIYTANGPAPRWPLPQQHRAT